MAVDELKLGLCLHRPEAEVSLALEECAMKFGAHALATRVCKDHADLLLAINEVKTVLDLASLGGPARLDLFLTTAVTPDLQGLLLKHTPTKIKLFVQEDDRFIEWGYY